MSSWPPPMNFQYGNYGNGMPYNSIGGFMDIFGGLTYDHANSIFANTNPYAQESMYPSTNTNLYEFGYFGNLYYDYGHGSYGYMVNDQINVSQFDEYRRNLQNPSNLVEEQTTGGHTTEDRTQSSPLHSHSMEGPWSHHNSHDYEVVWQDSIDPDNMTYEELLELGEAVGTQNRGLSQEIISSLPVSKFKCGLFSRKKSRKERCVICQMEYKRRDKQITLPCKHVYHASCGSSWLSINKACPICYKEVSVEGSRN